MGVAWLLLLPLNDYSRQTYVSENAILPGQVHTYFGGSEHNIFRAYRQEAYRLSFESDEDRDAGLEKVLNEIGLKTAQQPYRYTVAGEDIQGTNVYGLLQGPRADATEAMVLMAAWKNFEGQTNWSGVALALTLARYFKRWSIWSKDILVLFPAESTYGSEAWVSAYHSVSTEATSLRNVSALPIKAGALQGAVALDYPVGPWGHRFDKIDIQYDGINGALPNLDLLNTAVSVASGQMHIGCTLHGMAKHSDSYRDRLETLGKGLVTQAAGHATGPHSPFMPYHVDAITLKTVGDGWHDEMSLGRTTESLFRSINNLLEHLHQSFFFYILLNANRFVSIGNYLPAAMLIAGSFTITALGLWVESGRVPPPKKDVKPASTDEKKKGVDMEVVREGGDVALVPVTEERVAEREVSLPSLLVLGAHLAGFVPLYLLNTLAKEVRYQTTPPVETDLTVRPVSPNRTARNDPPLALATLRRSQNPGPTRPDQTTSPNHAVLLFTPPRRHALHTRHAQLQPRLRRRSDQRRPLLRPHPTTTSSPHGQHRRRHANSPRSLYHEPAGRDLRPELVPSQEERVVRCELVALRDGTGLGRSGRVYFVCDMGDLVAGVGGQ